MNLFFADETVFAPFPTRLYARPIEWIADEYLLFDAVDAAEFDAFLEASDSRFTATTWFQRIENARIYAVEVDALSEPVGPPQDWLRSHPPADMPEWAELRLQAASFGDGVADVFANINGPSIRASLTMEAVSLKVATALRKATDLTPYVEQQIDIANALPSSPIDQVFVLDVGQGSGNALISGGQVLAYVDLGAGVLKNTGTWPSAFSGLCVRHTPTVILSHWHYDHFHGANKFRNGSIFPAHGLTWIAPLQTLGPGPQSAMAGNIAASGKLMIWNGSGTLSHGNLMLERCTGPTKGMNRDGIAVWIDGPNGKDPILLPADAGYNDMPRLVGGQSLTAFTVSHHGGRTTGNPPGPPASYRRVALSYGNGNTHKHPNAISISGLSRRGWSVSSPPSPVVDERRTEDRRSRPGGTSSNGKGGLGHIKLDWAAGSSPAHSCPCGCTLDPTQ